MSLSLNFIRVFFTIITILLVTAYTFALQQNELTFSVVLFGIAAGISFALLLIGIDILLKQFTLKTFNIAFFGLFCGYLMSQMLMSLLKSVLQAGELHFAPSVLALVHLATFLVTGYLCMMSAMRASEDIYASIPFIKFKPSSFRKKDLLVDASSLLDTRIIDLANSGLLDNQLIMPRFLVKEFNHQLESHDENVKAKAKRCLDALKKLENIPTLEMRYSEIDFNDVKESMLKLIRLARMLDANLITADVSRIQQASMEGIKVINIHFLSNALKPLTQAGEFLNIKIQHLGKGQRQGVGYLEDGTMVVVNGGAEFIRESIKAQVISSKQTTSGRIIFCNAIDDRITDMPELDQAVAELEQAHKNYFAL